MGNDEKTEVKAKAKSDKPALGQAWRQIWHKYQSLGMMMIALVVLSLVFLIFSLTRLNPQGSVVIVGYGDVYGEILGTNGGYRQDSWWNMLAFPCLAIIFGVLHNILVLRVFQKYGKDAAYLLVGVTIMLLLSALVVELRLLGEG